MLVLDSAHEPESIENRSFDIIDSEVSLPRPYSGALWEIARRMAHTLGDISIVYDALLSEQAMEVGINAMLAGCTIFTDTQMAKCGMVPRRLNPLGVEVKCILENDSLDEYAKNHKCTRSKAGILHIQKDFAGNILAIGNAPTALLTVLDILHDNSIQPPALIIGMPVGFVNAEESKELLAQSKYNFLTVKGRKGGSALVAAVVNALAILASERKNIS